MAKEEIFKTDEINEKIGKYCGLMAEFINIHIPSAFHIPTVGSLFIFLVNRIKDKPMQNEIISSFLSTLEKANKEDEEEKTKG